MQCPSSQDKSKLTIQQTVPVFATEGPHVPPESRLPRLGACSVVVAVTQEKRLSYSLSVRCISITLLLHSTHALLKSHIGKRSCSAKELILTALCASVTPFCAAVATTLVPLPQAQH